MTRGDFALGSSSNSCLQPRAYHVEPTSNASGAAWVGNFIVLKGEMDFVMPDMEYREVAGAVFAQKRNNVRALLRA